LHKNAANDRSPWEALDPAVADALRPAVPALATEVIAAVQAAVPEYEGAVDEDVRAGVRQALHGFLELIASGEDAQLPERDVYVDFGRREYRVGRSLDALMRAYRAGAQVAWRGFAEIGDGAGLEPRVLYTLAEAIFAYIDELSAASAEGYAGQQSLFVREQQEHQRRLLGLLLRDPPAPAPLVETAARAAGWPLPNRVAALAFEAGHADPIAARLPLAALVVRGDRHDWALVPDPDAPRRHRQLEAALRGVPAALGPTVAWNDVARSARRARLALGLARQRADGRVVVADEELLELLLLRDPRLAEDLAHRRLEPLEALSAPRRERLTQTLQAWLDAHGDARAAAETLHVHVQTVRYRLGQLRELLGGALDDPRQRVELFLALKVAGRRAQE
jgi:hypothetical protein